MIVRIIVFMRDVTTELEMCSFRSPECRVISGAFFSLSTGTP